MTNFGPFGHIISATVSRDKATGLSKCFGALPTLSFLRMCVANVCNRLRQLRQSSERSFGHHCHERLHGERQADQGGGAEGEAW